ncbi:hypothetical protein [Mangrovimonas sp. DI 80]|uniref:hypothetical protein n=1 Tax=Mangrovimonas sp. DI 80 TaxID=1779330 RepID=UPI000977C314|nr:hypothetical protein [Mangrovimonas sp. DI 80]OMP30044.1 hypothetical protein BKM32_14275 [Mangrovimonas sp. DI 80]
MAFQGIQATKSYQQINNATPDEIFPLLCPVREKDWIDGWDYTMIFSKSGLVEKGCVFSTPHHGKEPTIWYVTQHDPEHYKVEFVRITPKEEVVRIYIVLEDNHNGSTTANITYEYTGLNDSKNKWIATELDKAFEKTMKGWEKAINHYLEYGEKLFE